MKNLKQFIKNFNFSNPSWENLPEGFPKCDLEGLQSNEISSFLAIVTTWELAEKPSRKLPYLPVNSLKIPTPSRNFPYPPVVSRNNPSNYGKLRERLRGFTGKEVKPEDLSFELLIEFVNKSDYLLRIVSISLSSFYSLSFLLAPKASASWFDDSYTYRQRACPACPESCRGKFTERVDITNGGSAQTHFQLL